MAKYWSSLLILFIVDRLTKIYFIKTSSSGAMEGDFFNLYLNSNIAFSLPLPSWLLYPLLFLILIVLLIWLKRLLISRSILHWPVGLITLGAVSNLLDRISYGGVVDFIDLPIWTVFNLSDVYIGIGVIWLIIWEFKRKNKKSA